jgi:hypothetical protein
MAVHKNCARFEFLSGRAPFFARFHLLSRQFRDVGLFAQKTIALCLSNYDMADTWKSGYKPAFDVTPDLHNRNAQVNGRFFNFESAPIAKGNLCTGVHDTNTNTPT